MDTSSSAKVARYFALAQPKLRAFVRSLVFDTTDADDILQDVAVIAIEKADRFDTSRGDVGAWVMGIARKRVMKYLEKGRRQKLCFSTEVIDALTDASLNDAADSDSLDALQSCLKKLERGKRELLIRRHSPGVTARELAQKIGYTDTRMSRLLNSLYVKLMKCVQTKFQNA